MGGGDEEQTTTSTIDPVQSAAYADLVAKSQGGFDQGFFDPNYAGGGTTRAGQTAQQLALQERISGTGGASDLALGAFEKSLGPYDPNNAALTGAIDMAAGDVTRNLQENLLPSIGDAGTSAGQFGSTRHGVAEGIALRGASEQVGDIATQMRLADMQQFTGNQQANINNLGSITQGQEYAVGGAQREEQGRLDDLFSKWEYESGVDLKNLQAYKGLVSGDMGGTETSTGPSEGK